MNIEEFRSYCLSKKGATEEFPFDNDTLVFKVAGKMFAATSLKGIPFSVNLKCDPELAIQLRESYTEVKAGYHMNKKHWNTVDFSSSFISPEQLVSWIDHSYDLVVAGLSKKARLEIEGL